MKRHPFEPFSFVFGLAFAVVGATFLFGEPDVSKIDAASVWPYVAIFIGLLVLAGAARRTTRSKAATIQAPTEDEVPIEEELA